MLLRLWKQQKKGHSDIVKILLDSRANVNAEDDGYATALILAVKNGHTNVVKILLDAGANTNIPKTVYLDYSEEKIINKQKDPNYNVLMLAKEKGYTEIVELLKSYGMKE